MVLAFKHFFVRFYTMNDKKIQNERNDFHGKMIFSIITFFYILSFERWYDQLQNHGGEQIAVAESDRDLHPHQDEAAVGPKLRDLCRREERGSSDFILGTQIFYESSYYDEIYSSLLLDSPFLTLSSPLILFITSPKYSIPYSLLSINTSHHFSQILHSLLSSPLILFITSPRYSIPYSPLH